MREVGSMNYLLTYLFTYSCVHMRVVRDSTSTGERLWGGGHHHESALSALPRGNTSFDRRMASLLLRDTSLAPPEEDTH